MINILIIEYIVFIIDIWQYMINDDKDFIQEENSIFLQDYNFYVII